METSALPILQVLDPQVINKVFVSNPIRTKQILKKSLHRKGKNTIFAGNNGREH